MELSMCMNITGTAAHLTDTARIVNRHQWR